MTVEDVHLAETQAALQDVLQQRRTGEAVFLAGDHVDHQHFLDRRQLVGRLRQLLVLPGALAALLAGFLVFDRRQQGWRLVVQAELQIALLRLDVLAAATIQLAGAHRRQFLGIQLGIALARRDPGRAEQVRIGILVRQVGEAVVQPEFQFALAAAHAPPAIEENAGDDDDADDDQPLTQTDFHEFQPLKKDE
ncbi:hypothetical protein D9M70_359520 [compost metagenome]